MKQMKSFSLIQGCMLLLGWMALTSCTNHNAINIIITNTKQQTLQNVEVSVSLKEVCKNLAVDSIVDPILLNEKNLPVSYQYNSSRDSIRFSVPVIHIKSQKTYSINRDKPSLSNSFLRIRGENIRIDK
jgi:hypothetical protein